MFEVASKEGTLESLLLARPAPPEEPLIEAAVAGDVEAFADLYCRHVERVHRHVVYWVGAGADAEDLTQQTFLQAWRAIGRYRRTGAPFTAWLIRIAHNLILNRYQRQPSALPLDSDTFPAGEWSDPEARVLIEADRRAVQRAILRLRPEHQQVLVLRFVEGFDCRTTARTLGKSEANVRVLQHRALLALRRLLEPHLGSER